MAWGSYFIVGLIFAADNRLIQPRAPFRIPHG